MARIKSVESLRRAPRQSLSPSTTPFLRLPSEIRREIYRYLLPQSAKEFRFYCDCDAAIVGKKWDRPSKTRQDDSRLAILRASQFIHYEAASVLYSENIFHFIGTNYLPVLDFIRRLTPDARDLVRRVRVTLLLDVKKGKHDLLCTVIHDALPGLTSLYADPWIWI